LVTALVLMRCDGRPGLSDGPELGHALATGLLCCACIRLAELGMFHAGRHGGRRPCLPGAHAVSWANRRLWGTAAALLSCVARCLPKQDPASGRYGGVLVALLRSPRNALAAREIAGARPCALGLMQALTDGGISSEHIVGYNINRFSPLHLRHSLP